MTATTTTAKLDRSLDRAKLVNVKELSGRLSISTRAIWRLSAAAEAGLDKLARGFPRPLRLGTRTVRWRLSDVEAYLSALAGEEN